MALFLLLLLPLCVESFLGQTVRDSNDGPNVGDKLILTPLIKSGEITKARKLSEVPPLVGKVRSYAGFLTVDEDSCESNMFFWFFPAANNFENAPVSVWLQGGPGASSLYGLFNENGPYDITVDNKLQLRTYSWHQFSSFLYIDNPVGTGFSSSPWPRCYSQNQTHVGQNLLSVVKQIMQLFPEISSNPFYVTGESYAGKYVPALAYAIHKDNQVSANKISLQGLAIGNGLVDPVHQLHYSDYLYQLGLIDTIQKTTLANLESQCRSYIQSEQWTQAFFCFDKLISGDETSSNTYFYNATGFQFYFNYLHDEQPPEGDIEELFNFPEVRKAMHVGDALFTNGSLVRQILIDDVMKSVVPWLEELLEHYRVLIYNGQLDIIVAYPLTEAYLKTLNWSASKKYATAERHQWKVDNELAGYVKVAGNLADVMVRNSGHMVPADQPKWAFDLLFRFIHNKPYF